MTGWLGYLIIKVMLSRTRLTKDSRMLALSFGRNGLFVNALDFLEDKGYISKHWHTSYPWKDFLFPYWYKGGEWNEAVLGEINQQLAFEYFPGNIPASADKYIIYSSSQENSYYQEFKQKFPSLIFTNDSKEENINLFRPFLENYAEKVVFVELNFMNFSVAEFSPRTFGTQVRWEYKLTEVKFKDINELLARVLKQGYLDFITTTTPANKLHNAFVNHLFYMPAITSDLDVIDFYRAVYFDLVAEISEQITISSVDGGLMIISGELPAFLQNKISIMLLVLDILGIRGTWACHFDNKLRVVPWMHAVQSGYEVPNEVLFDNWDLVYAPIEDKGNNRLSIFIDKVKYLGIQNEIHRFAVESKANSFEVEDKYQLLFPDGIWVNTLTIDLRKRPVRYGRKLPNNREQIKKWLASLSNVDRANI